MKNRIGLQLKYWWASEIGKDIEKNIAYSAKTGADYVEFDPGELLSLPQGEVGRLRRMCSDLGLSTTVNGGMMRPDAFVATADKTIQAAGLDLCRRTMECCAEIGSPLWTGVVHGIWCWHPGSTDPDGIRKTRQLGLEGMRKVVEIAEELKVTISLELVNRYEMFYLNTAEDGIDFCKELGSPYCNLLLDTFHMNIEENSITDALRLTQENGLLGCLHLGESNRRIPTGGPSNINWEAFGQCIQDIRYPGPMTLEPFMFNSPRYSPKICAFRDLADPSDMDAVVATAKAGVSFIRRILGQ